MIEGKLLMLVSSARVTSGTGSKAHPSGYLTPINCIVSYSP